jgi:thiamine-phosphate pyrophosphorylase
MKINRVELRIPPVYPITDKHIAGKSSHLAIVRELVRGGATWIQIRDKETPARELLEDLRRCVDFASENGALILVNDRCDLAMLSGAAGAHIGRKDLTPEDARILLGRKAMLGYSNDRIAHIREANQLAVDYLGFGPVFPTSTKLDAAPEVGLKRLAAACKASQKPVVAIGGIDLDRIRQVLDAGARSAAVVSTLMKAKNLAARMEQLLRVAGK